MNPEELVVQTITKAARILGRRHALGKDELLEVIQETAVAVFKRFDADAALRVGFRNERIRFAYCATAARSQMYALWERRDRLQTSQLPEEVEISGRYMSPSENLEMEDAARFMTVLRRECGKHARFALDVLVGETTIEDYATESQVSIRTAQRRFAVGTKMARKTYDRLERERDGDADFVEFVGTVRRRNEARGQGSEKHGV